MREPTSFLGLELAGAKTQKTAIAAIQFFPKERKIFLLDIYEKIAGHDEQSGDDAILEVLNELRPGVARMGVNVPLDLPPCISCTRAKCSRGQCLAPEVKWMRNLTRRAAKTSKVHGIRVKEFTPYTQRPVELWARYQIMPELAQAHLDLFEIDEALGGTKAPLTARMSFLKRHLGGLHLVEVWPKLTVALLAHEIGLHRRLVATYRNLEEGAYARAEILEAISEHRGVFIYDRDLKKLSRSLGAFDAFICAYTALLSDLEQTVPPPKGFPAGAGWVAYPQASPEAK